MDICGLHKPIKGCTYINVPVAFDGEQREDALNHTNPA